MAFDLFPSLAELGKKRNITWYDNLLAEDQKGATPFVLGRWLTGTSDKEQILRLNENVNPYMFSLGSEKALLFKLLASACTGTTGRYQWIKAPGAASASAKLADTVIADFYEVSIREAKLYRQQIKGDTILQMAEELGYEKEDIAKLQKELGNECTGTKKSGPVTKSGKRK